MAGRAVSALALAGVLAAGALSAARLGSAHAAAAVSSQTTTAPCAGPTTAPAQTPSAQGPAATCAAAASALVVSGHGDGVGIGMSQWGAYGYALHGASAAQILLHYYRGTSLASGPSPTVRVLLSEGRKPVQLGSASPWRIVDAAGVTLALPAGALAVPASLRVDGHQLASPLTLSPGTSPLELGAHAYRGRMVVVSDGTTLQVVNAVGLEAYLEGVVGAEMPSTWPQAALEAQAIASRSFALAQVEAAGTGSTFDLYGDVRSQVYGGIEAESAAASQAVSATAHEIVVYDGQVATTYFCASSGGETMSAAAALGTAVPYLLAVADPYDVLSPYHDWGPVVVGAAAAGKALGLAGPLLSLSLSRDPSGRVASVTAQGAERALTLAGYQLQADLGLPSTWFSVGWLSLAPPGTPVAAGTSVALSGLVRGVSGVTLDAQSAGAAWQTVASVRPGAGGAFSIEVTPAETTRYRLALGTLATAPVTVRVSASTGATTP